MEKAQKPIDKTTGLKLIPKGPSKPEEKNLEFDRFKDNELREFLSFQNTPLYKEILNLISSNVDMIDFQNRLDKNVKIEDVFRRQGYYQGLIAIPDFFNRMKQEYDRRQRIINEKLNAETNR